MHLPQRTLVPKKQYVRKPGASRPAKPERQVLEGIVFVLRTGSHPLRRQSLKRGSNQEAHSGE